MRKSKFSPVIARPVVKGSRATLLVGALFATSPVVAQMTNCVPNGPFMNCYSNDGSFTNCSSIGPTMNCHTIGGSQAASSAAPPRNGGVARGIASFISQAKDNSIRKRVGEMLANGNCEEAGRYALNRGRLELGEQILQSCQLYPATASQPARPAPLASARQVMQPSISRHSPSDLSSVTIEAFHRGQYAGQPEPIAALAKQGFAPAQNELGMLYQQGQGVPQNNAEAIRLFRLAAAQGMRDAQANLAWMYENGQGVTKNIAMAKRYYGLAADQGDRIASVRLNALMTGR